MIEAPSHLREIMRMLWQAKVRQLDDAWLVRLQSGRRDRVDRRGAGGIVLLGSNVSTLQQIMAAMRAAEALRSDMIGRIDLRLVGDSKP
jgi:hypothetical protein